MSNLTLKYMKPEIKECWIARLFDFNANQYDLNSKKVLRIINHSEYQNITKHISLVNVTRDKTSGDDKINLMKLFIFWP